MLVAKGMSGLMKMMREGKIAPIDIQERPLPKAGAALAYLGQGKANNRQILKSD